MQYLVALWILGIFLTLPTIRIETITGLIPIYFHLKKLSGCNQLQKATLSHNYAIKSLLKERYAPFSNHHQFLLEKITFKQWQNIKSSVNDSNFCLNSIFPLFDSLNKEFCLGSRPSDSFSSCYSFLQSRLSL